MSSYKATSLHGGLPGGGDALLHQIVVGALLSSSKGAVSGKHSLCLLSLIYDVVEEGWLTATSRHQESVFEKKNHNSSVVSAKCGLRSLFPAILISDSARD